jgi:uncharacterized repeat protein (TIGR03943 family)
MTLAPETAAPASRVRPSYVSPARVLGAVVIASWAALFGWLLITGRTALYLSSRTAWVVPLGAAILGVALLGRLGSLRTSRVERVTPGAAAGAVVVVLPVVIVLALPPASLGSYAASRRSSLVGASGFGSSTEEIAEGRITLIDVAGGLRSRQAMKALVARAGAEVGFVGFVNRSSGMPADEFLLTRFLISCCAADALSVQVRVVGAPPGRFGRDDWVRVRGRLYPLGREVLVSASDVVRVERPRHPYLNG